MDLLASIGAERIGLAIAIALIYIAFTVWCLRRSRTTEEAFDTSTESTLVAYASQTGFAQQVATQTASSLQRALSVRVAALAHVNARDLTACRQALFVVSTTGEGDAPDSAASFVAQSLSRSVDLSQLSYGVLALGDREYDNFCGFGHRLDSWLRRQGATPLFDIVEVDNGDEGALRHWQYQLSVISGKSDLPDWEVPKYEPWRLVERTLLNPGSAGGQCYHIALEPTNASQLQWQAGDIAEIDPCNSTWNEQQPQRPHREYSIASLPSDGAIQLLVRQMHRENGELGSGSGWLTQDAELGTPIGVRIRRNENFHPPGADRPLILIGNGTGIAGLRALIKARVAAGTRSNWLIFGERQSGIDAFYSNDLESWHRDGWLKDIDLVFSRDNANKYYVQHRLLERETTIREWIAAGAAVYVCGSLQGMAPGVHAALLQIVGADVLEQLSSQGRYRRDVY